VYVCTIHHPLKTNHFPKPAHKWRLNIMSEKPNHGSGDRRVTAGLFQWREGYTNSFEHFLEAAMSAQEDYNKLTQQFSLAQTPYDLALAWSEFAQRRTTHIGAVVNEAREKDLTLRHMFPGHLERAAFPCFLWNTAGGLTLGFQHLCPTVLGHGQHLATRQLGWRRLAGTNAMLLSGLWTRPGRWHRPAPGCTEPGSPPAQRQPMHVDSGIHGFDTNRGSNL
jgi:hypothetical protein